MEEQLGDLLEDFFFCAANHEKLSKRVDYFQLSDDERPDQRHETEEAEDSIQLNTPQRAQPSAFEGSKYDMCTVVEESNEEDGEDSSHRKERRRVSTNKQSDRAARLPDSEPASFHLSAHKSGPDEDFRTPSSRKKAEADRKPPQLSLASISALVQNFHLSHKAPSKTLSPQQLQGVLGEGKASDRRGQLGAIRVDRQAAASSADRQLTKKKNSKVQMIEKLEKNIFRLFAETKHECFRPKSSKHSSRGELQQPERTARVSENSLERAKKRRPLGLYVPRPEGKAISKSVESDRDFSKLSSKDSSLERPHARTDRRNPLRKRLADQHLRIRGTIEKLTALPDRFLQNHIEKDKISLSFNLDLSRILTRKCDAHPDEPNREFEAPPREPVRPSRLQPATAARLRKVPQNSSKKPCQQSDRQSSVNASERSASREDSCKSQKTPKKHSFVHAKPLGEFLKRVLHPGPAESCLTDRSAHAHQLQLQAEGARKQRASLGNVHFASRQERTAPVHKPDASCTPKFDATMPKLAKSSRLDALKQLHRSVEHEPSKLSLIQKKLQHSVLKK